MVNSSLSADFKEQSTKVEASNLLNEAGEVVKIEALVALAKERLFKEPGSARLDVSNLRMSGCHFDVKSYEAQKGDGFGVVLSARWIVQGDSGTVNFELGNLTSLELIANGFFTFKITDKA